MEKHEKVPNTNHKARDMSDDYDEDMMVSNILDNFDDIDPEEQSMFMNLNIRNRR